MANKSDMSLQKGRKRVRMRTRISILILAAVILQMFTAAAVLVFGGEFRELREYSYQTLVDKTENRSADIRTALQKHAAAVQTYAEQLGSAAAGILKEHGASAAELQTDRELAERVLAASGDMVSELLQRSGADEAYLLLETGASDAGKGGDAEMAAVYLRAAEPANGDLLTVPDHDAVAQYFATDPENGSGLDFYSVTVQTAQTHSGLPQNALGYWSSFSEVLPDAAPSMKYSVPLIAADGTVYGILGIGLTADTVLSDAAARDLQREAGCYVLGYSESAGQYDILLCAGETQSTLLGSADALHISGQESAGFCDFDTGTDAELSGSVQDLALYDERSPYAGAQWALISVADRSDVLWPVLFLQRMLVTAVLLSLIVTAVIAAAGSNLIVRPLMDLSRQIRINRKYNAVVRFQPSSIYEIDAITDAITQMQINVHGFSSQVSKMISVADVGLGTFMYDRTDDTVFVGQSLIKILRLSLPQGEDIMMSRREFLNSIENSAVRAPIAAGLEMQDGTVRKDFSKVHDITRLSGRKLWMRLSFTYASNTAIGIVQDITDAVQEKHRIEYERDYDHLTGLLNRQAYYRRIEKLFHNKSGLRITAFIMIDLDNLKYVNDTYGHNFGDDYIKTAASALKKFHEHGGIVSRLSGDEFSICLPGFSSKEEVREIITDVRSALLQSSCLLADGTRFKVGCSMGVSWYPDDSESREQLMKYADFAMYTIKHSTKGSIAEFDWNTYSTDSLLVTGVEEMNRIIEECSVRYAFQSIVSAKTGEIYGYEALMRVQSEIFQSPLELLRTAKTGAKLYEIERMTLTKSLADFQALIDAGKIGETARIFINSIANNRLEPEAEAELAQKYAHLLNRIVIEILEGESSDEECTAHKAELVRNWGGQLALDDFGTGYNSEYALLSIRPHIIKIDRSIVNGCEQDADRRMIIENLVKLARAKGILVLAEGVETLDELKTVIACGVDLLQGYYLSHPLFDPEPIAPEVQENIRRLAEPDTP